MQYEHHIGELSFHCDNRQPGRCELNSCLRPVNTFRDNPLYRFVDNPMRQVELLIAQYHHVRFVWLRKPTSFQSPFCLDISSLLSKLFLILDRITPHLRLRSRHCILVCLWSLEHCICLLILYAISFWRTSLGVHHCTTAASIFKILTGTQAWSS